MSLIAAHDELPCHSYVGRKIKSDSADGLPVHAAAELRVIIRIEQPEPKADAIEVQLCQEAKQPDMLISKA